MRLETRRGSDHPASKFEPAEAEALWRRFHSPDRPSIRSVSRELEVNQRTVYKVIHRISYRQ